MSAPAFSDDVEHQLERWPAKARQRLVECLEDAASELQREFIQRAVAAGHSPAELHAFADEIRGQTDSELYDACTLGGRHDFTVEQLLRAESDPLYAFELNGHTLSPEDDGPAMLPVSPAPLADTRQVSPVEAALRRKVVRFDATSGEPISSPGRMGVLKGPPPAPAVGARAVSSGSGLEEAANDASRALGVSWRDAEVDVPGGLSLAEAVRAGSAALTEGLTLALWVGPRVREPRRAVIALQLNRSGTTRAWQLYDPLSGETVWAHEADLQAGHELPFVDKANRRVTRILLPTARFSHW